MIKMGKSDEFYNPFSHFSNQQNCKTIFGYEINEQLTASFKVMLSLMKTSFMF